MKLSKALTWDELADEYDKVRSGRPARTLPMDTIFDWAKEQTDQFKLDDKEGTLHKILED